MARISMSLMLEMYGFIERVKVSPPVLPEPMREEAHKLQQRVMVAFHMTDESFEQIAAHTIEQEAKLLEVMDKLDAMAKVGTRRKKRKVKS